ncbi:MAG: Rieske (2Fe-2S) protein [Cyanobacteria bacterium HKST-UBA06]|nr:Rieske (2Fe-2S) protein [Cyanobacteria bacterium HKST-UBA06]MCA9842516.1 Rieske (2Fe-2S) protein [Cyanobacteria bacterium HKST-UBA03]
MNRRSFLKWLAGGLTALWGVGVLYPVYRYLKRPEVAEKIETDIVVASANELSPGQSKRFKFGKKPGLLIRDQDGNYHAYDSTCTHLACIVQHRPDQGDIFCGCHNGRYDLKGNNVSGPPPRPLTKLPVSINAAGEIVVSRPEGVAS